MSVYSTNSKAYDLIDKWFFMKKGTNPREVIQSMIGDSPAKILDLCCGTLSNSLPIAKANPQAKILGFDLSKEMLDVAIQKCEAEDISNVFLKCTDATNTHLQDKSIDYVILGLVLHESTPDLREKLLHEAYRVLKDDGFLIVLEWEHPKTIKRKLKFYLPYVGEKINCKYFRDFYRCNKEDYFKRNKFDTVEKYHCNYSIVLKMRKHGGVRHFRKIGL